MEASVRELEAKFIRAQDEVDELATSINSIEEHLENHQELLKQVQELSWLTSGIKSLAIELESEIHGNIRELNLQHDEALEEYNKALEVQAQALKAWEDAQVSA